MHCAQRLHRSLREFVRAVEPVVFHIPVNTDQRRKTLDIATRICYYMFMNAKQRRTLRLIFTTPVPATLAGADIESLLRALGATLAQGRGSRVRVELNGHDATFHTPHPSRVADRGRVRSVREFLEKAGVTP